MFYKSMLFRIVFLLLLILFVSSFKAQTKELDSLRNLVYSYKKEDTTKVRLLYDYHFAYDTKVNYDSMEAIQLKVHQLALKLENPIAFAKSKILKSRLFSKKGDFNRELVLLKESDKLLPKETLTNELRKFIYSSIGVSYFRLGYVEKDLDSCIFYYKKASEYSIEEKNKAKDYARISQAYSYLGEVNLALGYNEKILKIAKSSGGLDEYLLYYSSQKNMYDALNNTDSIMRYAKLGYYKLLENKNNSRAFKQKLIIQYRLVGGTFYKLKEFDSTIVYYEPCLDLSKEVSDIESYKSAVSILTYLYSIKGLHEKSLALSKASIDYAHSIGDTSLIATSKYSMTFTYDALKEFEKAIQINNEIIEDYLDVIGRSTYEQKLYTNQSYFYHEVGDFKNAVKYGLKSLSLKETGASFYNLGDAFLSAFKDTSISKSEILPRRINGENNSNGLEITEDFAKEEVLRLVNYYYHKAIENLKREKDFGNLVHPHNGLGDYYDIIRDVKKAIYHYEEAWKYSNNEDIPLKDKLRVADRLYKLNKEKNKVSATLKWLEIRDSLEKVELSKNDLALLGKKQAEFEYSQKIYADSLTQKQKDLAIKYEQEKQALKLKAEEEKKYYLYGGLFLLVLFLFVLYRRFKVAVKQKHLIELQKESIEEKRIALRKTHEGVQDSINYSKRIQKAVFPSLDTVKGLFPDSFLFFKPKDVVSGDFYWVYKTKDKKIIVTADCTGHGVPGAFMTIIGINILKEIVQEGIVEAGEILKEINKRLIERLSQQGKSSVKDGMDLALCIIDDNIIEFVGAHLPLYHVRNGELNEYKGSNIFLGSKLEMIEPKVNYIPYNSGDLIYMSTDGLPDQKGGEKGKKFYSKRLKEFLLSNSKLSMVEQETKLVNLRKDWLNGKYEQLDDITIVGIKL